MRFYIYLLLIFLYIFSRFFELNVFCYMTGITACIALLLSLFYAKSLHLYSGLIFLVFGLGFYIYNLAREKIIWHHFFLGLDGMLGILSLFLVLPFINSVIRVGKYDKNLSRLLKQKIDNASNLYMRSSIVCHFLALFLNIATIPLLVSSLTNTMKQFSKSFSDKFLTRNLLRAYTLCLAWNPLEVMVVFALDLTNEHYFLYFFIIIFIVIFFLLADWFLAHRKYRTTKIHISPQYSEDLKTVYKNIAEMFIFLLILVLIVSITQFFTEEGFLFCLVLAIVPLSFLWAAITGKSKRYRQFTLPNWKRRTEGLSNYFFMFLSAGFFVEMIIQTEILSFLETLFIENANYRLLFYFMIGGFFFATSLIGFHPLVSMTLLAALLDPILSVISSIPLALVLITSSLATVMYSPFNLSVSILADSLKLNAYRMGATNILFAVSFMIIGIFTAYLLGFYM